MTILVMSEPCPMRGPVLDAASRRPFGIRLLAYDANAAAEEWPGRIEPRAAAVIGSETIAAACAGCEAVIQLTLPTRRAPTGHEICVDVDSVRRVVDAIAHAGVRRLVSLSPVSSLARAEKVADLDSHLTDEALEAEDVIRAFPREWLIIRAGLVYGPDYPVISPLLTLMRALPAVPLFSAGAHRVQPLWHGDLADILARSVELRPALMSQIVAVAGPVTLTMQQLYDQLAQLSDRPAAQMSVPDALAAMVAQVPALYEDRPHDAEASANVIRIFGIRPTSLAEGVTRLMGKQARASRA